MSCHSWAILIKNIIHHVVGILGLYCLYLWFPDALKIVLAIYGVFYGFSLLNRI
jgi:hypothetical protein